MHALVTGANGHLGFNLVQLLASRGHRVRAGVRSVADTTKTARLRAIDGVDVVDAPLEDPAKLRAAMDGVDWLFQVAAVYQFVARDRDAETVAAARDGGTQALRAAADAKVRKVILTSSTVTLPLVELGDPRVDESRYTEDLRVPYIRAKVEGEQEAWRTAQALGLNLVTILPCGITGPGFERPTPTIDLIESIMYGGMANGAPDSSFPVVDVRDVAAAHLLAAEQDCDGRFIAALEDPARFVDIARVMRGIDPSVREPSMVVPRFMSWAVPIVDAINHRRLGVPRTVTREVAGTFAGRHMLPDTRRIRRVLGWQPQFGFEQTLSDTMALIRARREART